MRCALNIKYLPTLSSMRSYRLSNLINIYHIQNVDGSVIRANFIPPPPVILISETFYFIRNWQASRHVGDTNNGIGIILTNKDMSLTKHSYPKCFRNNVIFFYRHLLKAKPPFSTNS